MAFQMMNIEHVWPASGLQSVGGAPNWQPFWIDQDRHGEPCEQFQWLGKIDRKLKRSHSPPYILNFVFRPYSELTRFALSLHRAGSAFPELRLKKFFLYACFKILYVSVKKFPARKRVLRLLCCSLFVYWLKSSGVLQLSTF